MQQPAFTQEDFFKADASEIADYVVKIGGPKVGVFVPDGNKRLILACTDLSTDSEAFYTQLAVEPVRQALSNLRVFFGHGLPTLVVPLFSRSVLDRRSPRYRQLTALKMMRLLFTDEEGDDWLDFYERYSVRVRVYGEREQLTDAERECIAHVEDVTRENQVHRLFFGIGGEPVIGLDVALAGSRFYQERGRKPAGDDDLVIFYYGEKIEPADFFIMSSKFSGLGALPGLICDSDTQVYFLSGPGVSALTERTYRAILYDLLFMRSEQADGQCYPLSLQQRAELQGWYQAHGGEVIGLGRRIGNVWVPELSDKVKVA
jgi:hypothetical protein